ncbi:MAG: hypothetical protein IPL51_06450 [Candidatus Competibacteraceae bacterium]|nr:hypothetical protein [Candidatus Competibacteraceae bacterium]
MLVFIHFLLDKFHVGYEGESGMDVRILTGVTDTLDHRISGFSQQQAAGESLTFTSQHGSVEVASLPIVIGQGTEAPARPVSAEGSPGFWPSCLPAWAATSSTTSNDLPIYRPRVF